ncbi:MAG TPA: M1 family aminopeptidase, partial [Chitinophagaceae bacterium]|nr:M1 family aminopeptidase [Chitinophagaceae bacterium]
REFYGVWGDFDVTINIDKSYLLGGTGYLQNADQIGFGYEKEGVKVPTPKGDKLSWHFIAPNVHDFMWAADPEFIHKTRKIRDSLVFHLLYKTGGRGSAKEWEDILDNSEKAFPFIEKSFGGYPYKQFSFIDGGDGGMEYPMATLLAGPGAWLHEWLHNWYYGMLGTNESEYAWMDEGFTEFATDRTQAFLRNDTGFAHTSNYNGYYSLVKSEREEPLTTHADHYNTNLAYGNAVYSKGCVFLSQLGYITGEENLKKIMLEYYRLWRFKHPNANDFIRVAEKVGDMKLDWYREYWISSTKTIDYSIDSLWEEGGKTKIRIRRIGDIPMPIDFQLTFKDGSKELHYIPMYLMFGEKPAEDASISRKVYEPWKWTHTTYIVESSHKLGDISIGEIDPSQRLADIQRKDNRINLSGIK